MPNDQLPPPTLIDALRQPRAYPHDCAPIELVETHISWVLLTGGYAYKLKKPVDFGFLDFSTLPLRRAACEAELRLNRRLAPELYVDVVPVTGTAQCPHIGGDGAAIEYAVRMRQFPQTEQLDRLLDAGALRADELEAFGRRLAAFHGAAPRATQADGYGTPEAVYAPLRDTLDDLLAAPLDEQTHAAVVQLDNWSGAQRAMLMPLFAARRADGHVREGHGDLHLANLVRIDGRVTAFDCIEFSAELRWTDTISDAAFLVMDLAYRGHPDLAYRFLNAYIEACGDHAGLRLLNWYRIYRALVRAKVAMLRAAAMPAESAAPHRDEARKHIELAQSWSQAPAPMMVLTYGLSGSGKTWLSARLAPLLPAIHLRSDVERKRLHGLAASESSGSPLDAGIYTAAASQRTYDYLVEASTAMLAGGLSVIVDAACLKQAQRKQLRRAAEDLGLACVLLECRAPDAELQRRLAARAAAASDASEADQRVLAKQRDSIDPLDAGECANRLIVDTSACPDVEHIVTAVRQLAADATRRK